MRLRTDSGVDHRKPPIYLEGIPAGWYILEELKAPEGFVKSEPFTCR